jgi:hypothetical protein
MIGLAVASSGTAATMFVLNYDGVVNNGVGEVEAWGDASSPTATVSVTYDAAGNVASHDVVEDATDAENGDILVTGGDPAAASGAVVFKLLAQKSIDKTPGATFGNGLTSGVINDGGNGALGVNGNPSGGGIGTSSPANGELSEGFVLQFDTSGLAAPVKVQTISLVNFEDDAESVTLVDLTDPARDSATITLTGTAPITLSGPGSILPAAGTQPEMMVADVSGLNAVVPAGSAGLVDALSFFHGAGAPGFRIMGLSYSVIPEPSSAALATFVIAGFGARWRRLQKRRG